MTNPFHGHAASAPETTSQPEAPAAAPAPEAQPETTSFSAPAAQAAAPTAAAFNNAQGAEAPKPAGNLADMFNNGASAGGDKFTEDLGAAVLIRSNKFVDQMATQHGPTDAMEAEWIVLDGPNQGQLRQGLIFATVIVNSLNSGLNSGRPLTVGVISRAAEGKNGKSAPFLLNEANETQINLAVQAAQAYGWA